MRMEHAEDFRDRALFRSFMSEDRAMQIRMSADFDRAMLPGTEETEDFADIVRDEVKRIERTANVVTSVAVEDHHVHVMCLLGHDADQELVERLLEDMQQRVFNQASDR